MASDNTEESRFYVLPDDLSDSGEQQLEFPNLQTGDADEVIPPNPFLVDDKVSTKQSYQKTGEEILQGDLDPSHWAASVKASSGDQERAKLIYANWRQETLEGELHIKEQKREALEHRKMKCFSAVTKRPKQREPHSEYTQAIFWEGLSAMAWLGLMLTAASLIPVMNHIAGITLSLIASVVFLCAVRKASWLDKQHGGNLSYVQMMAAASVLLLIISVSTSFMARKMGPLFGL
ncbi:MAG: hypothetical protein ACPG32_13120 [Akkermansiaceae bacterium]